MRKKKTWKVLAVSSLGLLQLFLSFCALSSAPPCHLLPSDSRLKSMSVTLTVFLAAVGFILNPFKQAHDVHLCRERCLCEEFTHRTWVFPKHFPSDFVHLYSRFLCQNVDIVWTEREMLLLQYHASLKVSHRYQNRLRLIFYFSRILQESYCGGDFVSSVEPTFSFTLH